MTRPIQVELLFKTPRRRLTIDQQASNDMFSDGGLPLNLRNVISKLQQDTERQEVTE